MNDETIDIKDVAQMLKVNARTINRYVIMKKLPAFKVGNKWRFKKSEIESWIENNRNTAGGYPVISTEPDKVEEKKSLYMAKTINVPLLGNAACGMPMLAEENKEADIQVSADYINPAYKYFFLRATGDSMNAKGINDGDLVLIRQQPTARDGDSVVALIDDSATIKEYHVTANSVVLKPCSTNPKHQPIVLNKEFTIQGVVVTVIKK
jgi:SOS regulatory protein LexA